MREADDSSVRRWAGDDRGGALDGRILQIGSQRVSSIIYAKAKELLASGAIGQLNMVTARWDRNSAIGAWDYTVPPDASPETCDWPRFLGTAPKIPFNAEQFFQWRKWKAYGSGVAGDLFVHLFSGTHFITGSNGPTRGMATGGLRFWKDGRDVPDVMLGLFDYREGFNLSLHVNFVDGGEESEGLIFTGSEGTMEIAGNTVTVNRVPREREPGLTIGTFHPGHAEGISGEVRAKSIRVTHPDGRRRREWRSMWRRLATATATITSRISSTLCAHANSRLKMRPSDSVPRAPRC